MNPNLARLAVNQAHVRTNLYNAGLTYAGCDIAYSAAIAVGANPEQAFEAARQHMLVSMLPRDAGTQTQRFYANGARQQAVEQRRERLADMTRIEALPNPFAVALQVAA